MSLNLIEDNLYLGDFDAMRSTEILRKNNIEIVLSVFDIEEYIKYADISYHRVKAYDSPKQDLLSYFQETNQIIAFSQLTRRTILVHCMAGVSRSATIVIAFIMNKHRRPFREAIQMVRNQRPDIDPNPGFRRQLKLYEGMAFNLDPNNKIFRNHLLNTILFNNGFTTSVNSIDLYFERRRVVESGRKVFIQREYLCADKYCVYKLFNDLNLLDNFFGNQCENLFIEPQEWMKQTIKDKLESNNYEDPTLKCPKCERIVGYFNQNFQTFGCNCNLHQGLRCLYFKIYQNSVQSIP